MELGQIKYFTIVARLQNMSKAAQILGIAQPTLSRSIAALEKELGTQLFDRSGKKLILNKRGKLFLDAVSSAIEDLESAAAAVKNGVADRTINIGLFCMSERLMHCLAEFSRMHPELMLDIRLINNSEYIDTNEFDVLLYPQNALKHRYKGQYAYTEKFFLAVNKSDPLADKESIGLNNLSGRKLIFIRHGPKSFDSAYNIYRSKADGKSAYSFCGSYDLMRPMIASGQYVGFIPEGASDAYRSDDLISLLVFTDEGFEQDVFIGFKREKHLSEHGRSIMAFISDYFRLKGRADG